MKGIRILNNRDEQGGQAHATRNALGMVFPNVGNNGWRNGNPVRFMSAELTVHVSVKITDIARD